MIVSIVLLWLTSRQVDLSSLSNTLATVQYTYILLATLVYFLDLGFRALRWRILLGGVANIPTRRLYPVLAIGYMLNNLLPVRIGEISRAYLVGRREHLDASVVLATIAIERIADGLTIVALLLVSLSILPSTTGSEADWVSNLALLAGITFGLGTLVIAALVLGRGIWVRAARSALTCLPGSIQGATMRIVSGFIDGLGTLKDQRRLAETAAMSIAIWVIGALTYLLVAAAFGVPLSPIAAITSICVVNLATAIPLAPAGLGAFEVVAVQMFVALGVGTTIAFGMTIVLHAVLFFPVVVVGMVCLWRAGLTFGQMWRQSDPTPNESAQVRP